MALALLHKHLQTNRNIFERGIEEIGFFLIELPIELPIGLPIVLPIELPIGLPIGLPIVLPIGSYCLLPIGVRAKPRTVRQAKDCCQAKQRQSGKHPTVP